MGFPSAREGELLRIANVVVLFGMASVALAVIAAVWLVLSFVGIGWFFSFLAAIVTGTFVCFWFVFPIFEPAVSDPHSYE